MTCGLAGCRAALYIRLSREDENEGPSESVTNQQALLDAFVQKHGVQVCGTYIDDGWSGTSFDRPAFRRMIADIEAKRIDLVITKDLSRLGRDYILTGHYMERYFPEHGVRYISLLDGIDTGIESSANDITPFRAILNDMYAKDISKKIKSVKRDKQRRGQFIGGKPVYGYKMHPAEKNRIVIDEGAAPTVRRIFALALEGISCRRIAAALNAEGIPSPAAYCGRGAGLWSGECISRMLQNETYIGSMVQGRQARLSYKSKKCLHRAREDWVVVPGTHAPLIDEASFRRAGELLEARRRTRTRTYEFPLKGLVLCRECGHPLAAVNRPDARGKPVLYFLCRTYQRDPKARVCTAHCVKVQTVADAVLDRLRTVCTAELRPDVLRPLAEEAVRAASRAGGAAAERAAAEKALAALTGQFDRVYADRLAGLLPEADFRRILARIQAERDRQEARLRALNQRQAQPEGEAARTETLVRRFLDGVPENRELLARLIERVEVTQEKEILIRFRFADPRDGDRLQLPPREVSRIEKKALGKLEEALRET